ncbi:MAG: hypothetical protein KatS3mg102_0643 [Planctomycetota bacterium]|nr:MAG: hypothetical protein KatS3mg102_0643 [Planctomycetota bacterium]
MSDVGPGGPPRYGTEEDALAQLLRARAAAAPRPRLWPAVLTAGAIAVLLVGWLSTRPLRDAMEGLAASGEAPRPAASSSSAPSAGAEPARADGAARAAYARVRARLAPLWEQRRQALLPLLQPGGRFTLGERLRCLYAWAELRAAWRAALAAESLAPERYAALAAEHADPLLELVRARAGGAGTPNRE